MYHFLSVFADSVIQLQLLMLRLYMSRAQTPPERGGSGDFRPIPWASLTLITNRQSHCRKQSVDVTPEILGYFSTRTQCVN